MKVIATAIKDVVIIEPQVFGDDRGYFFESYSQQQFDQAVRPVRFVQDNESKSRRGVLRGLHFQKGAAAQSKLVRVVQGRVLDVAVDIRRGSPTFGKHVAVELTAENHRQLFVPRGFAHGFSVLSDEAVFQYKCDNFYAPPVRRSDRLERPRPGDRLATPRRGGDPLAQRPDTSPPQRCRRTFRLWNRLLCITYS